MNPFSNVYCEFEGYCKYKHPLNKCDYMGDCEEQYFNPVYILSEENKPELRKQYEQ